VCLDEDEDGQRNTVPLTPLDSFFTDNDSLKQQKKKKPKKMKEGKMPKVKKRKKEVNPYQITIMSCRITQNL
jgi:prophage tail gpP-like protein